MDWAIVGAIIAYGIGLGGYCFGTSKAEKLFKEYGNYREYIRNRYDNR